MVQRRKLLGGKGEVHHLVSYPCCCCSSSSSSSFSDHGINYDCPHCPSSLHASSWTLNFTIMIFDIMAYVNFIRHHITLFLDNSSHQNLRSSYGNATSKNKFNLDGERMEWLMIKYLKYVLQINKCPLNRNSKTRGSQSNNFLKKTH